MSGFKVFTVIAITGLISVGCVRESGKKNGRRFEKPEIPELLFAPEQRVNYLVCHYWDRFDFRDTAYIRLSGITEQAFVDFLVLLPRVSAETAHKGLSGMMARAETHEAMYSHFHTLAEKYLYDLNSPFYQEEYYMILLEHLIGSPKVTELDKVRPRYQLEMIRKNRPGMIAADFTYTTQQGKKMQLSETKGNYILLFFYNPDCQMCAETNEYIRQQGIGQKAEIVWVNPEKDKQIDEGRLYDLRAIPTLYLLDKDKKVLLKDAPVALIDEYLQRNT